MHFQKPMLGTLLDWSNPLNKGCVMHLACNEGHGDVVRDLSMNGNHGTVENMAFPSTVASGWNPGRTGVGLNFDGGNDCVNCGNNTCLDITNAITISAFIYPTGWGGNGYGRVVAKTYATGYLFNLYGANQLIQFGSGDAGINENSNIGSIELNKWQHVVVTYNKQNVKFYIDGVYEGGGADTASIGTNNDPLYIGNLAALNRGFEGSIDQVRIHNRALTAKEVQDYYINPWQVYLDEEGM